MNPLGSSFCPRSVAYSFYGVGAVKAGKKVVDNRGLTLGTPRLKMDHLAEKLTKGWGILTAKIPLVYMLKAQQFISLASYLYHRQ